MEKSVIIIGAGVAGLATGCYGQMNGYHTRIFEMHDKPGGLCTAWTRKGYTIDGCLHWLTGSAPESDYYHIWEELGVVQGQEIIQSDRFFRVESADGTVFDFFCNIDQLERHMLEMAPEDTKFIHRCARAMRHFTHFHMPVDKAPEMYNLADGLKMMLKLLPFLSDFRKWSRMTMAEFARNFKNPLLRQAWQLIWPSEFSAIFILITLALMHMRAAGYIIGGSARLSRAMENRYLGLGGEIRYKSPVTKIFVENDRAVGVRLADGSEHRADYVVSAADGYATIFDLLGGKYLNDKIRGYYDRLPIFPPLIYIGLGVNRAFDDVPQTISGLVFELDKPVVIAGKETKWLNVRIHSFDPTLTPAGKTLLTVMLESQYSYWAELRRDMERYRQEKEQIAATIIRLLEKRLPGLASQVEMHDVATPVTFHRYTGNWQGSYEGWLMTPATVTLNMSKTLPGLENFYMAGHWVMPGGGLPSGALTGRYVVQMLCRRDRRKFVARIP